MCFRWEEGGGRGHTKEVSMITVLLLKLGSSAIIGVVGTCLQITQSEVRCYSPKMSSLKNDPRGPVGLSAAKVFVKYCNLECRKSVPSVANFFFPYRAHNVNWTNKVPIVKKLYANLTTRTEEVPHQFCVMLSLNPQ